MKKIFTIAIVMALSGTAVVAAPTASSEVEIQIKTALDNVTASRNNLEKSISDFLTLIAFLPQSFENELAYLNKTVGYDPRIYAEIVKADALLEKANEEIKALQKVQGNPKSIDLLLNEVNAKILYIKALRPEPSKNFPDRCADTALADQYTLKTGFIDKGTNAPTGWALRTLENDNAMEYPISKTVGLIGAGTLINPSYTPQGYSDSGWYDPATKQIVCLGKSQKL